MPSPDPTFKKINPLLGLHPDHHKKVKKYRALEMNSLKVFLCLLPFVYIIIVLLDYFMFGFVSEDRTRVTLELIVGYYIMFVVIIYSMSNKMIYVDKDGVANEHWTYYEPFDVKVFEKDLGVSHEKYRGN